VGGRTGPAPPEDSRATPAPPSGAWAWLAAGLLGGAFAGALDAGVAIARGIGGLAAGKAVELVLLAASVLAFVGGVAGALVAGARSLLPGDPARRRRTAAAAVAALFAPLVLFDAFALFGGPRAARVPAHGVLSVVIGLVGVAGVYTLARLYGRRLEAGSGRGARQALLWGLLAAAVGAHLTNREVLPRLYAWFHATLSVMTLSLAVAGMRVTTGVPRASGRLFSRTTAAAAGLVVIGCALSFVQLERSQVLRFAAYERTATAGLVLRAVPESLRSQTAAGAERQAAEQELPPLPDGPRRPDADVLVVTIDALRADHVGAYGYKRPTTPNIDALAAGGTRFQRAYSQAPHTSFSVASMLTGKYFPTLARLAPGEKHEPIAAVLRTYGWRTAAFYPPAVFFVDAQKLKTYAETHFDFEYVKFEYIDAQRRVDQIVSYYDTVKPKKSFVWVHFFEPHEPYESHEAFPFGSGDMDRYDSEIAYTDAALGRLVAYVRKNRPGTIIVVAADHGEEFDEHGGRYHGSTLYEEQLRIPLVISIPGVAPRVVSGEVELIDVTPTVLNLLDIPVPARMRGTDLGPWLATPPAPADRLPPAFAEVEDRRMVVWHGEKLICDLHWGFCAYYDLAGDPGEKRNLSEERPARAASLRATLDHWLDGHMRFEPLLARGASNPNGGPLPKAIERGRLGDLLAASDLAALMTSRAPAAQRREAAQLLVGLPPRKETAAALSQAAADPDRTIADWAAVGAVRLGDPEVQARVKQIVADPGSAGMLRVRAALALATAGDPTGVPVLAESLDQCDDVLLCRLIILSFGKLRDRRAVPALLKHLPEVQNRREMVDALGDIGDPSARDALLQRLASDGYVPVRVQAARALAKIARATGDRTVLPMLESAARHDTEPTVVAAAREAVVSLGARAE
jgi:arylsulfatase A-like enzyme/HEAT repeat protein